MSTMEQLNSLIEEYESRVKTANHMIMNWKLNEITRERVSTRAIVYSEFIKKLKKLQINLTFIKQS